MQPTGSRLILYGDKEAEFSLYDVADIHFMNRGCAKSVLEHDMKRIAKDPFAFWVLGGDYCDFIDWNDQRFDPECVDADMTVNDLAELAAWGVRGVMKFLLPIKDKCLGAAMGNHEKKYMTGKAQAEVHPAVCVGLESQDLKYSGWFDLYFENRSKIKECQLIKNPKPEQIRQPGQVRLRVMVHHGFSAATTSGGRVGALKKALDMVDDADLVMLGHMHEQIAKTNVRIGVDDSCQTLTAKSSLGLITGTYLRTYAMHQTGYGEIRGYPPTTLGATRAVFCPLAKTLTVENRADEIGLTF